MLYAKRGIANFSLVLTATIICAVFFILSYSFFKIIKQKNTFNKRLLSSAIVASCTIVLIFILSICYIDYYDKNYVEYDSNYSLTCRASSVINYDNYSYICADNVVLLNENSNKFSGNVTFYLYNMHNDIKVGDNFVIQNTSIVKRDFFDKKNISSYIKKSIYLLNFSNSDIQVFNNTTNISEKFKDKCYEILSSNMNFENANLAYTVLFGDKNTLDSNIESAFSSTGVAHILAVSGLNIAIITSLLMFIFRFLKIGSKSKLVFLFLILFIYCYLCNFSPSVVRASVMSVILLFGSTFGLKYDKLNSLSFAGIICILFLNPFNVFTLGFQLSFLSVFAIITLCPVLDKLMNKIHLKNNFTQLITLTVSVNFVIFPICAHYFNQISLISVLTNIIVVPVYSIAFALLFFISLIVLIIPFMCVFLKLPDLIFQFIKIVTNKFSQVAICTVNTFDCSLILLLLIIILCFTIRFVMISKKYKIIFFVFCSLLIAFVFALQNLPIKIDENKFLISYQSNTNCAYMLQKNNTITLVGSKISTNQIEKDRIENKFHKIDYMVAYDAELNELNNLVGKMQIYNIQKLYLPKLFYDYSVFDELKTQNRVFCLNDEVVIGNIKLNCVYDIENKLLGVNVSKNKNFIFVNKLSDAEFLELSYWLSGDIDYLFLNTFSSYFEQQYNFEIFKTVVSKTNTTSQEIIDLKILDWFTILI